MNDKLIGKIIALGALYNAAREEGLEMAPEVCAEIAELGENLIEVISGMTDAEGDAILTSAITDMLNAIKAELSVQEVA